MARRRLLVATYHFPPDPSVGGRRWEAMADWLRELGHDVTVLTTSAWGGRPDDWPRVRRTGDLVGSRVMRQLLQRPALPLPGQPHPPQRPPGWLLSDVVVPDAYLVSWAIRAVLAARTVVREGKVDCLITSGPPHSAHLIGLMLERARPAWIADFRDGWRYEMLRAPWPTRAQDLADAWLERRVINRAEVVIGVTRPIAEDVVRRFGARAVHIPNGWNPGPDLTGTAAAEGHQLDASFVNVVYTGRLSLPVGRDPRHLFDALPIVARERPDLARRLRLVIAGPVDVTEQGVLASLDPVPQVVHIGHLDRAATASLQRNADALMLLTSPGLASHATGKLFEYLASGRPIIALAEGNEAARIVGETGTGVSVAPDDPKAIAQALLAAADGSLKRAYSPHGLDRYIYPAPAIEMADAVEEAIATAGRRLKGAL